MVFALLITTCSCIDDRNDKLPFAAFDSLIDELSGFAHKDNRFPDSLDDLPDASHLMSLLGRQAEATHTLFHYQAAANGSFYVLYVMQHAASFSDTQKIYSINSEDMNWRKRTYINVQQDIAEHFGVLYRKSHRQEDLGLALVHLIKSADHGYGCRRLFRTAVEEAIGEGNAPENVNDIPSEETEREYHVIDPNCVVRVHYKIRQLETFQGVTNAVCVDWIRSSEPVHTWNTLGMQQVLSCD
jgi:hypothetical protein